MAISREPPDDYLAAELTEVSADAEKFAAHLRADNNIPAEFPKAQLEEIATSLYRLPHGTAAAAFDILKYASRRLPSIRREYLLVDSAAPDAERDTDLPPPQMRGMTLDRYLKDLIASVVTALDECRKQEGETGDNDHEIDVSVAPVQRSREMSCRSNLMSPTAVASRCHGC